MKINLSAIILMVYLVGFLDIVISTNAYKVNNVVTGSLSLMFDYWDSCSSTKHCYTKIGGSQADRHQGHRVIAGITVPVIFATHFLFSTAGNILMKHVKAETALHPTWPLDFYYCDFSFPTFIIWTILISSDHLISTYELFLPRDRVENIINLYLWISLVLWHNGFLTGHMLIPRTPWYYIVPTDE